MELLDDREEASVAPSDFLHALLSLGHAWLPARGEEVDLGGGPGRCRTIGRAGLPWACHGMEMLCKRAVLL